MLVLIPFVLYRTFLIVSKKEEAIPLFDSMLWGATAYAAALIALNMYGTYYLLPAYAFAIPAIIYFFKRGGFSGYFWKIIFALTAFIMIFNALPAGLYYLTYNKYLPINFNNTLDFLIKDMKERYPGGKPTVFLDGSDLIGGRGTYFIFSEFMNYKGFDYSKFDMKSNTYTEHPEPLLSKIIPKMTVFES
ncbi:MAG: hypothetical protein NTW60_00840, partial [Candidatus Wolfebacteria bacterium]|nr:hypothetical protein [Candidatus Wolfebacteria bacterium]